MKPPGAHVCAREHPELPWQSTPAQGFICEENNHHRVSDPFPLLFLMASS